MSTFTLSVKPGGKLRQLIALLDEQGKAELNQYAGARLYALVQSHLRKVAKADHKASRRIGAMPTGHLERAAQTLEHREDSRGVTVSVYSPGFGRVFRPLHIRAKRARALTIPVHPLSYGRRVSEVSRAMQLFRARGHNVLMAAPGGGDPVVMYVLRKAVMIPQDRGLLPTDGDMSGALKDGYVDAIRAATGGDR